jgi:hypothetical protein
MAIVACSRVIPKRSCSSDPGAKKSMIRPIAHGIPRFTPVDTVKPTMPSVSNFHCGLASARSRANVAASGTVLTAVLSDVGTVGTEFVAAVGGRAAFCISGDTDDEGFVGGGGVGVGFLGGWDWDELKRI